MHFWYLIFWNNLFIFLHIHVYKDWMQELNVYRMKNSSEY